MQLHSSFWYYIKIIFIDIHFLPTILIWEFGVIHFVPISVSHWISLED